MKADQNSSLSGVRGVAAETTPALPLDALDLALLKLLVSDSTMSQRQIATTLGVSPPTVAERTNRLERNGTITGYSANLNWSAIGYGQVVYLSIRAASGYDIADIMTQLWAVPQVEEVSLMTGDLDLLVRLRVHGLDHLRTVLMDHVWQIAGMQGTTTLLTVAGMPPKPFERDLVADLERDLYGAQSARPSV